MTCMASPELDPGRAMVVSPSISIMDRSRYAPNTLGKASLLITGTLEMVSPVFHT